MWKARFWILEFLIRLVQRKYLKDMIIIVQKYRFKKNTEIMKLGSGLIYHHHRHRHSHSLGSHQLGKMICTKIGLWHMIFRIGLGQTHFEPKMCQTHIEPKSIFLLMLAALYSLLGFSGQELFEVLTGSSVVFVTGGSVVFVFVLFSQGCITCMIDNKKW